MKKFIKTIYTLVYLLFLFFLMGLGVWLAKEANIGLSPWNSLNDALTKLTPFSFGEISQLLGIVILAFAFMLGVYPGVGTILNIYFIGLSIDIYDLFFDLNFDLYFINVIILILGTFFIALGFTCYIKVGLGQGPRDSLTHGLYLKFNMPFGYIKFGLEAVVLIIAILLGGSFGIGTFISLFTLSFFTQLILKYTNFNPKSVTHKNLKYYFK